jgi:hypothetical protein
VSTPSKNAPVLSGCGTERLREQRAYPRRGARAFLSAAGVTDGVAGNRDASADVAAGVGARGPARPRGLQVVLLRPMSLRWDGGGFLARHGFPGCSRSYRASHRGWPGGVVMRAERPLSPRGHGERSR